MGGSQKGQQNGDDNGKNASVNSKNGGGNAENGVIKGHQASHDFWGRQNCSPPRAPITHETLLADHGSTIGLNQK